MSRPDVLLRDGEALYVIGSTTGVVSSKVDFDMTSHIPHSPIEQHKQDHTPQAVRKRLQDGPRHSYLRDFIYGAIDGAVTTFAVVAGVVGAQLSPGIIVILGAANLFADGFSMAISNFVGTKAEEQMREKMRKVERDHIDRYPKGEREEIRQIFAAKGFVGEDLDRAVQTITSDVDRWVDTMLTDELGVQLQGPNAYRAAWSTFIAFVVIGSLPLLVFVYEVAFGVVIESAFLWSSVLTGVAFFIIGAIKSRFIGHKWWTSGLETLAIGAIAAGMAYGIGVMLRGLAGDAG